MTRKLYSARAKFVWAFQQARVLEAEMKAYVDREPCRISVHYDRNAMWLALIADLREEVPSLRWGMMFAECLQAYRSSLDHAMCEIAAIKEGTWPRPATKERNIQYPICDTEELFRRSLWRLGDMRNEEAVVRRIEGMQPYTQLPTPLRPILTLLREITDQDKHRAVNIVLGSIPTMRFNIHNGTGEPIYSAPQTFGGPVEDGKPIVIFHFDRPQPDVRLTGTPEVTFYPALPYQVSLESIKNNSLELTQLDGLLMWFRQVTRHCLTGLHLLVEDRGSSSMA